MKKPKQAKPGFTICPDCGAEYKDGAPHMMFCAAHTCEECGCSYGEVLEIYDGRRLCEECWETA